MAKTVNYTPEMVAKMTSMYDPKASEVERAEMVAEIAAEVGKTEKSVIAKLSREGVYVKKVPVSKVTGDKPAKKENLAAELVKVSGLNLVSAEKLNKTDLVALIEAFENMGFAD